MPGRISSPALIGREHELGVLRDALRSVADDARRVVLVHGEAGIGKTRLLDELARSVEREPVGERGTRFLRGACLDLGDGDLPYAPILDILDELGNGAGTGADSVAIRGLRDQLGGSGDADRAASGRGRIFVAIRDHLVAAALDSDVVVVVDDVHWADRSTLELLTFLSTRLTAARVLLILAYRSDEIHRRHPLRAVLAELGRGGVAADVPLEPLGRRDVRDQLGAILGVPPDTSSLDRIASLADGNPFYVEELAALEQEAGDLPRSLRDTLLARLERLDDPTLEVLGRAAVIGRDVDEQLLAAVSDLPDGEVRSALRAAIASHVLEAAPDGRRHRFRHALLREAVLDDLLPSERIALHRQVAEVLEARPELAAPSPAAAAAELAYQWSEAGDASRALPAMLEAGRTAEAARAWTEASDALERAAALAATGAGSLAPIEIGELLMRAAILADFAGDLRRGLDLGRAAVDADDGADPRRSGVLLNTLGTVANDAGDFDLSVSANEQAILLIPAEPPSVERADAVATLGARRMILNRNRDAIELVDDAIAFFRTVDQPGLLGAAMAVRGLASASLGRADEARVAVDESLRIYGGLGDDAAYEALEIITNSAFALHVLGDFDRVPQLVDGAMAYAAEIGDERGWGIWLEGTAALTAFVTGDWAVAAERSRRFTADSDAGFPLLDTVMMEAELAAGRGDRRRVEALLTGTPDTPTHQWFTGQFARINAVAALWDGDAGAAATSIEAALATMATQDEVPSLTEILKVAVRSYTDIAERRRATRIGDIAAAMSRATELAADVASLVDGTYLEGARSTPWMQAIGAQVAAETGRAEGRSDPQAWASAAAAHAAVGTMPEVAYCRYRQAEALLTAEDRSGATAALVEAVELARRIGMVPLVGWIETIARRSRLSIEASVHVTVNLADEPHDPWGLSPREREVLDLLGEGRTNRQIGETLFISEKTASVHVTHILGKLGVSSRTEAALLAGRSRARP